LHSFADGGNSFCLIVGNRFSQRPPDREHPFGYGLEAGVWALVATVTLLILSLVAIWEGGQHLLNFTEVGVQPVQGFWVSVGILAASVVLELMAVKKSCLAVLEEVQLASTGNLQLLRLAFRHIQSVVSPTTKFVFWESTISFVGAVLALMAIVATRLALDLGLTPEYAHLPDTITSVIIGLMLMGMAFFLFRHNRTLLTQTAASPRVENKINDLVMNLNGVSEVLDLKTIDHGLAGLTVHLQVEVDPYTLVKDVDDLTERIKEKIQSRISNVSQVFVEVLADESEIEWGEKFDALVEQGKAEGVLDERAVILLKNVYDFTECTAKDIMIPRIDVESVELNTPLQEVADLIIETGHSRLPVYKESVDDLVGLVHARDVFEKIRGNQMSTPLFEIVREIDIFPENKPISDLLEDFKRNKIRVAAVADEHGGFAGLVTVEDVIEEIIGEIWDEHEEEEPMVTFLAPNEVLVNGKCEIEDLNEQLDINLPYDDFKTVGGYVFGELGREPEAGDAVQFEDLKFTVKEVDGPRIVSVVIESPVPFERKNEIEEETQPQAGGE
jgi:cation diffusion facilitator family transporter